MYKKCNKKSHNYIRFPIYIHTYISKDRWRFELGCVFIHSFFLFFALREWLRKEKMTQISASSCRRKARWPFFQFNYRKGNESESISPYLYIVDVVVVKSSSPWRLFTQLTLGGLVLGLIHYAGPGSSWKINFSINSSCVCTQKVH